MIRQLSFGRRPKQQAVTATEGSDEPAAAPSSSSVAITVMRSLSFGRRRRKGDGSEDLTPYATISMVRRAASFGRRPKKASAAAAPSSATAEDTIPTVPPTPPTPKIQPKVRPKPIDTFIEVEITISERMKPGGKYRVKVPSSFPGMHERIIIEVPQEAQPGIGQTLSFTVSRKWIDARIKMRSVIRMQAAARGRAARRPAPAPSSKVANYWPTASAPTVNLNLHAAGEEEDYDEESAEVLRMLAEHRVVLNARLALPSPDKAKAKSRDVTARDKVIAMRCEADRR